MRIFGKHIHGSDSPLDGAPLWAIEIAIIAVLILELQEKLMSAVDDLAAAVAKEDTTIDSAIALIQGIPDLIAAAGVDPAKLAALQADITAKTAALAAAVVVGTPTTSPTAPPVSPTAAANAATTALATP